ncbi:ABC-type lipoprotein export system ATPase subunit [Novosphingobium chloroacetimidivorans]|uniref:ABC-type lipoprotein export system ATPase subunit n=1 Tax=Novosphingobium chloroacetimidivorans TaxID=1428314 RepID=A0A7W7KAI4_9SPHN|nr:AAA family ATPase [Novosphingobium chloroacetimidivorans]MBB4859242.1 ABC-type lipoprotein export system ATPase subunit [Novosphingobium chloroacetimidivorans]
MELFSVSLRGFRRFRDVATLRTNGKLVALVGPNEAGKSTILAALKRLDDGNPFTAADVARGASPDEVELIASFLLDEGEIEAAGLPAPSWFRVHKKSDGELRYSVEPTPPDKDLSHRAGLAEATAAALARPRILAALKIVDDDGDETLLETAGALAEAKSQIDAALLDRLKAAADLIGGLDSGVEKDRTLRSAVRLWRHAVEAEERPAPLRRAIDTLHPLVPTFLVFDEAARSLQSSYAMPDLAAEVPAPLDALMAAADLKAGDVLAAANAGDTAELATLERRANRSLEIVFREAWRQSGISVSLRLSPTLVEVQVLNEDQRLTRLAERSDGLRQFVALHAFTLKADAKNPILLIDEAEQRLHYNAQADLVQMLARQRIASKVVYTTHSAGCLPEDLGHGVRLVQPIATKKAHSAIVNKFWSERGGGVAPLLIGLGASTMAFFPTRRAVCVEGPSDMLLYPTMFREALNAETLGFQFVPGLSSVARSLAPILPAEADNVAFLVDGDDGGRKIAKVLADGGIPSHRIVIVEGLGRKALLLEDFVDPGLLLEAANAIVARHFPAANLLPGGGLSSDRRMKALEAAFKASTGRRIDKVELAYQLMDLLDADPRRAILDRRRKGDFAQIAQTVSTAVNAAPPQEQS